MVNFLKRPELSSEKYDFDEGCVITGIYGDTNVQGELFDEEKTFDKPISKGVFNIVKGYYEYDSNGNTIIFIREGNFFENNFNNKKNDVAFDISPKSKIKGPIQFILKRDSDNFYSEKLNLSFSKLSLKVAGKNINFKNGKRTEKINPTVSYFKNTALTLMSAALLYQNVNFKNISKDLSEVTKDTGTKVEKVVNSIPDIISENSNISQYTIKNDYLIANILEDEFKNLKTRENITNSISKLIIDTQQVGDIISFKKDEGNLIFIISRRSKEIFSKTFSSKKENIESKAHNEMIIIGKTRYFKKGDTLLKFLEENFGLTPTEANQVSKGFMSKWDIEHLPEKTKIVRIGNKFTLDLRGLESKHFKNKSKAYTSSLRK